MGDTADYYKELVESANNNKKSGFGGFFSFLGNQVYNVAESLGINKVYNDTKNTIDNKLNEYGIKDKIIKIFVLILDESNSLEQVIFKWWYKIGVIIIIWINTTKPLKNIRVSGNI